jgi:WD40 repeat protein
VALDNGVVKYYDVKENSVKFTLAAHTESITTLSIHQFIPGMLITSCGSNEGAIKVFDIVDFKPRQLCTRDLGGKIFAGGVCPDDPYLTAYGGENRVLSVWNFTENKTICQRFEGRESKSGVVKMSMTGSLYSIAKEEPSDIQVDAQDSEAEEFEATLTEMRGQVGQEDEEDDE